MGHPARSLGQRGNRADWREAGERGFDLQVVVEAPQASGQLSERKSGPLIINDLRIISHNGSYLYLETNPRNPNDLRRYCYPRTATPVRAWLTRPWQPLGEANQATAGQITAAPRPPPERRRLRGAPCP